MSIFINDALSIGEIKKQFRDQFNYLKIEFFSSKKTIPLTPHREILEENVILKSISKGTEKVQFSINATNSVEDVEHLFKVNFEADVQIMRHSGNAWLMTTKTDKYTLQHQNEIGKEMAAFLEKIEPDDIHEQE